MARGIGIVLVVIGHSKLCYNQNFSYSVIYSFHVPLFYFISGFVYKTKGDIKSELCSRAKKILLPYYLTAFLYVSVKCVLQPDLMGSGGIKSIMFGILWGSGGRGSAERYLFWPPLWFLTSLYVTQISYVLLMSGDFMRNIKVRVLLFTSILIGGKIFLDIGGQGYVCILGVTLIIAENGLPFNVDLVPITLFYFWLGNEIKNISESEFNFCRKDTVTYQLSCILIIFCIMHSIIYVARFEHGFDQTMDLNLRNFGPLPINLLNSIIGIVLVFLYSNYIVQRGFEKQILLFSYLGHNSLGILIFHFLFQDKVGSLIGGESFWVIGIVLGLVGPVCLAHLFLARNKTLAQIYGVVTQKVEE